MTVRVFNIQRFCIHDGPGIRTTVFLAGCPLRCLWCHNPEGKTFRSRMMLYPERCIGCGRCLAPACGAQRFSPTRGIDRKKCTGCGRCAELCPAGALEPTVREMTAQEILDAVTEDQAFYGAEGGITLSGGEPMSQPEAVIELFRMAKDAGITTALETSGAFPQEYLPRLVGLTDIFLWDWKDSDPSRFAANTGGDLAQVEENLRYADSLGAVIRLRCILIHRVNTDRAHAEGIRQLAQSLGHLQGIDLLRYHPMGESKYTRLGIADSFDSKEKIPDEEDIRLFTDILGEWIG